MKAPNSQRLHVVTPLSKSLAAILFILMPFVGVYIGYTYTPEKVVEIDRVAELEARTSNRVMVVTGDNNSRLEYSFERESFQYIVDPVCGPYADEGRGPFIVDVGDGTVYNADCKGVVNHSYDKAGIYIANYIENDEIIASLVVELVD